MTSSAVTRNSGYIFLNVLCWNLLNLCGELLGVFRNQKNQAGIIDLLCGLYLQDRNEIARHFRGDIAVVVAGTFQYIASVVKDFPKAMLQGLASESANQVPFH